MKKGLLGFLCLVVLVAACISCKIGLGEAVDTQAPELAITSPSVGAVIRDQFAIGGTWSDDGSIKAPAEGGLTIVLERTDNTGNPITYTGTLSKETGTWACIIDPKASGNVVLDGEYQATVTIQDTYEHKTTKSITFTVDNTAPVVVLQRPSSKATDISNIDSFGQTFTLEGQAADDNNVDLIEVSIYSDINCQNLIKTIELKNVPPTISLDVAKFGDSNQFYETIYGSTSKLGERTRYCKITAYDSAKRYPVDGSAQSDADKKGNSVSSYYLYDDISASVLNSYKITDVYHMLNGTYVSSSSRSSDDIIASVKNSLNSNKNAVGSFILNPKNNPTFSVSGRTPFMKQSATNPMPNLDNNNCPNTENEKEFHIANESKVVVEVTPGLDGYSIDVSNPTQEVKVYLQECTVNAIPKAGAEKIYLVATDASGKQKYTRSGSTYKYEFELKSPPLSINNYYIIGVEGYDIVGNTIEPSGGDGYAFKFTSNSSDPTISSITSEAKGGICKDYSKAGTAINFDVSVLFNSGTKPYSIYWKKGSDFTDNEKNNLPTSEPGTSTIGCKLNTTPAETNGKFKFTHEITGVTSTETYYYLVVDSQGKRSGTDYVELKADGTAPTIALSELPSAAATLASSVTFMGTASDTESGIREASGNTGGIKLTIYDPNTGKTRTTVVSGTTNWNYTVNFGDEKAANTSKGESGDKWNEVFATEGEKKVKLYVEDKVGNNNNYVSTLSSNPDDKTIGADGSWSFTYDNANPEISIDENTVLSFMPSAGFTISGTANDSLNLAKIEITETHNNSKVTKEIPTGQITSSGNTGKPNEVIWTYTVPFSTSNIGGDYSYEVKAYDGVSHTAVQTTKTINVDTTDPQATVDNPSVSTSVSDTNYVYNKDNFYNFTGTITEDNLEKAVCYLQKKTNGTWEDTDKNQEVSPKADKSWSWKVYDIADGEYRVRIEVEDKAGNSGGKIHATTPQLIITNANGKSLVIDTTSPTSIFSWTGVSKLKSDKSGIEALTSEAPDSEVIYYAKENLTGAAFTIAGVASDTNYNSIELKAKKDDANITAPTLTKNGTSWSFAPTLATDGTADGTYKYTLTINDKAGNKTDYVFNIHYDTKAPTVSIKDPANGYIGTEKNVNASGDVRDTGIGLKKLEYKQGDGEWKEWKDTADKSIASDASTWSNKFTFITEGAISLKVRATDLLDHVTESDATRFSYDIAVPSLTFNNLNEYYKTGNIEPTGTSYDSNKLVSVVLKDIYLDSTGKTVTDDKAVTITGDITTAKDDSSKITWGSSIDVSSLAQGSHTIKVIATDDAGRTKELTKDLIVDTGKPTVTLDGIPGHTDCLGATYTFRGKSSDTTSGVSKVELTVTSAEGKSRTVLVTGTSNWNYPLDFGDKKAAAEESGASGDTWNDVFSTEGVKTVTLKVTDFAGNEETNFKLGTDSTVNANTTFTYDKAEPVLTIKSETILEYMPTAGFTITGTASDTYLLAGSPEGTAAITVKEEHSTDQTNWTETTASKTAASNTKNITSVSNHKGNVSIELPLGNATPQEGFYRYTITLKDSQGNTTKQDIAKVTVDTKAPFIKIGTPATDVAKTGINSISEASYRFDGSFEDDNVVAGVFYKIIAAGGTAPSVPTTDPVQKESWTNDGWSEATIGTSTWSAFQSFESGTSAAAGSFGEGIGYKIYVYAVDKAGNIGGAWKDTSATSATRTFDVDFKAPTVVTKVNGTALDVNTTKIQTDTYTFAFNATDTFGLDSTTPISVTVKKDDVEITRGTDYLIKKASDSSTVTGTLAADTDYVIELVIPSGKTKDDINGLYTYEITAQDKVAKTTTATRNIRFDTKAPKLSILTPDLTSYQNDTSVSVRGSAEDDSGTAFVFYAFDKAAAPSTPSANILTESSWTDEGWIKATGTTSWNFTVEGAEAAVKNLYIVAVDSNGLVSSVETNTVKVDLTNPISTTDESSLITNTTFKLEGSAYDANGITSVSISDGTNTYEPTITGGAYATAKDEASKVSWEQELAITTARNGSTNAPYDQELEDGTYLFTITTKDIAGKVTTKTREVVIDTKKPTLDSSALTWADTPITGGAHTKKTPTLNITAKDSNLESVAYYVNDGSSMTVSSPSDVASNQWNVLTGSISNGTGTYSKSITFEDGEGYVYIKVIDKAGNEITTDNLSYAVDTTKPSTPALGLVDGETLNGTKLVNGTADITFTLTVDDQNDVYKTDNGAKVKIGADVTKIASVDLSKVGTNGVTPSAAAYGKGTATLSSGVKTGEWTVKVPKAQFDGLSSGDTPIYVKVTDISGNYAEYKMFSVDLDKTIPETSITSPVPGTTTATVINGTLDVTGNVKEDNPKSVALYYRTTEPGTSDSSSTSTAGWTLIKKIEKAASNSTSGTTTYTTSVSDITKFTFANVDFNTISGAASASDKKHDIWLLVYSLDTAGNASEVSSSVYKKYNVDMEQDRPVIKFSNLSLGATMASNARTGFENSELYGSVTDDDGVPETLYYFIGSSCPAVDATTWLSTINNSNFSYSNGSFTLKFLDANKKADDGEKTIFFKVTDKAGKTFLSSTGTSYDVNTVIVSDGTNSYGSRGTTGVQIPSTVYLKVDTQAPAVYAEAFYLGETASTDEADWSSAISAETFGGTHNKFFLYEYAYDANGVASLKFRIPVETGDSTSITPVDGYYEFAFTKKTDKKTSNGIEYTKWLSSQIDVTGLTSGTRQCEFVASDGIKSKTTPVNISIDNTPPTISVDSHTTDEQIRSSFALKGNFENGDANTTLKYIISTSATEPTATAWADATNVAGVSSMRWGVFFDNDNTSGITVIDGETHDKQPKYNVVDLMSSTVTLNGENQVVYKSDTSKKYTSLVRLYYHFKATDAIGNTSDDFVFSLKIDPQGDIPVILMSYPEVDKDASGNKKYGWYSVTANTPVAAQWFYTNEPGTFGASRTETVSYKDGEDTKSGTFTYKYRGPTALLSGIIRTIGTAEDDKTISGLYMQIDPTYDPSGEGKFNANWASELAAGSGEYTITSFGPAGSQKQGIDMGSRTSWNLAINKHGEFNGSGSGNNYIAIRLYAVDVDGNVSATEDNDFFIVTIDSGAPKIGSTKQLYVYQYRWANASGVVYTNKQNPANGDSYYSDSGCRTSGGTITEVAGDGKSITAGGKTYTKDFNINEYIDGMWLKGEWWLSGSVEDENGIQSATMSENEGASPSIITGSGDNFNYITANYIAESGKHDYLINYRVGSITDDAYGQIKYTLSVIDGDNNPTSKDFIINYDNKAPTVATNAAEGFAINTEILNDNGLFKVESAAYEQSGESGFERVVFYFKRTLDNYKYVYDAYMNKDQATNKWRYEAEGSESVNVVYDAETGLYWKEYTVEESGVEGRDVITVTNIDTSVHKGTLAKIGGVIYTVTNVSTTSITLDGAPSEDLAGTKVYFVVGHVVDHVGTEGQGTSKQSTKTAYGYGYYSSADDDGDMMVEKVSTIGTKTTWSGNINSQNIPDGPIEIHYVVFDKAGNSKHEVVTGAFVKNNAPRLASLKVWTDYNGNGQEEAVESDTKYYNSRERKIGGKTTQRAYGVTENLVVSGNDLNYDDANATAFKRVTDVTRFYPEIVGGNGHLYYSYKIGTGTNPANWNKKTGNSGSTPFTASATRVEADSSLYMVTDQNGESYVQGSASDKIEVGTSILNTIGNSPDDGPTWFEYTIWDSTPGTTRYATDGTGSLTAKFTVALKVAYVDTVAPKAVISPFFWKGQGKGTVQNADGTTSQIPLNSLYDGDKANGHIELEDDLTGTLAATIYGDTDPKVSGKITIRGTAYDDIRLSQLWVKFDGITLSDALTGTNPDSTNHSGYVLAATYDKSSSTWTPATAKITTDTNTNKDWEFSATDEYCTSDGHKVNWEFSINTAKHTNVSARNVKAYVMSVAERGSGTATYSSATAAGTDATNDAEYNKPTYQMDIVPYITAIKTGDRTNSGLKDNNIRSASGKYSIIKGNQGSFITVEGFNLNPGENDVRLYTAAQKEASGSTNETGTKLTRTAANAARTSFSVSNNIGKSGFLEVFTNGNRAMNNINKNEAHGSYAFTGGTQATPAPTVSDYKEMPNREADYDVTKNVQLTDDRYLRLFEMHKTNTKNGYYPVMIMDGDNPVFGYVDSNGCTDGTCTYIAQSFQPQRRKFNGSNGNTISTEYLVGGITFDQMAMAKDSAGRYYQVSVYNQNGGSMALYYDKYASLYNNVQCAYGDNTGDYSTYNNVGWQLGTRYTGYVGNYTYNSNNNALSLDGMNIDGVLVDRFQNIKLIADGDSTTTTGARVYHAYYDDKNGKLYFRQFIIGKKVNNKVTKQLYSGSGYEQYTNLTEGTSSTATVNRKEVISGSKHYDFGIVKNNNNSYAVFVYYDFSAGKLKLRYSSALDGTPNQAITWTNNTIDLPPYVGQYVSMAVSGKSLHISAFDANDSDLKYIYVPDYTKTDYTAMTVDAAGSVGNWTQIKIHGNKPYIAYYNSTETGGRDAIKLAYANNELGSVTDGVDKSGYTSTGWEYMTVPSVDPAQGGSLKFQNVCLDFDSSGTPVVGYLGTNLEFGKYLGE